MIYLKQNEEEKWINSVEKIKANICKLIAVLVTLQTIATVAVCGLLQKFPDSKAIYLCFQLVVLVLMTVQSTLKVHRKKRNNEKSFNKICFNVNIFRETEKERREGRCSLNNHAFSIKSTM